MQEIAEFAEIRSANELPSVPLTRRSYVNLHIILIILSRFCELPKSHKPSSVFLKIKPSERYIPKSFTIVASLKQPPKARGFGRLRSFGVALVGAAD